MSEAFVILLVEDDADDVFFLKEAFARAGLGAAVHVARDGEEACSYLLGEGAYCDRAAHPCPSLILLDLKLPRKSGLEFLEWRRGQPRFSRVPTVVLTSSLAAADLASAYELGANSYLLKPVDAAAQLEMVKLIGAYWGGLNKLP